MALITKEQFEEDLKNKFDNCSAEEMKAFAKQFHKKFKDEMIQEQNQQS
jgi:hypothetical protein